MRERAHRSGLFAGVLLAALILCGCTSNTWRAEPRAFAGDQGGAAEVVFSPEVVTRRLAYAEGRGPERVRRDAALNLRSPRALTANDAWVRAPVPSLRRPVRVHLRTNARELIFFERRGEGHPSAYGGY